MRRYGISAASFADFDFSAARSFSCCVQVIVQGTSLFLPTIISGLGKYTTGASGEYLRVGAPLTFRSNQSKPSSDPCRLTSFRQSGPSAFPTLRGSFRSTVSSSRRRPRSPSSDTSCSLRAATRKFSTVLRSSPSLVLVCSLSPITGPSYRELTMDYLYIVPCGPFFLAWATANAGNPVARAVTAAIVPAFGSWGSMVCTWLYLPKYKPRYLPVSSSCSCRRSSRANPAHSQGNIFNLVSCSSAIALALALTTYCKWENRQRDLGRRDHRLEGKTEQEIKDLGWRHPAYRLKV